MRISANSAKIGMCQQIITTKASILLKINKLTVEIVTPTPELDHPGSTE